MAFNALLTVALHGSLALAVALVALLALRGASAALRRQVALLGVQGSLLVPWVALAFPERPALSLVAPPPSSVIYAEALPAGTPAAVPSLQNTPFTTPAWDIPPPALVALIWAAVTLMLLARSAWGVTQTRRLKRRARRIDAGSCESAEVEAPLVVGILRPVVLLPPHARSWSAERRRAVLLHERAHVTRRDGLALLLARVACAVFWFQPLAWLLEQRLRRECELAADEDVLRSGMKPSAYADHLIAIARGLAAPTGSVAMAVRSSELGQRVRRLLSNRRLPQPLTPARAWLVRLVALLLLALAASTEAAARPSDGANAPTSATPVDRRLQSIVADEAARLRRALSPSRLALLILDPASGRVLASVDDAPAAPIVPASTLKPLVVALALDHGLITRDQRFDCGHGRRPYPDGQLWDAGSYGSLSVAELVAVSSNVGMSRVFDALGGERLVTGLARFGMPAVAAPRDASLAGAVLAIGQRQIATTPLALARAYGVFANGGLLVAPGAKPRRVIQESTASHTLAILETAVASERATGKHARIAGRRVAGKTGTSDDDRIFASFVGVVPADKPRYVVYVGIGLRKGEGSGGSQAAPAFARIAARALSR
jgi:beta-lactamase regulating signal transducer with metallopeptidase domain